PPLDRHEPNGLSRARPKQIRKPRNAIAPSAPGSVKHQLDTSATGTPRSSWCSTIPGETATHPRHRAQYFLEGRVPSRPAVSPYSTLGRDGTRPSQEPIPTIPKSPPWECQAPA